MSDPLIEKQLKALEKSILFQIFVYSIVTTLFLIILYENQLIYFLSFLCLFLGCFIFYIKYQSQFNSVWKIIMWSLITIILILLFIPFNFFHEFIGKNVFPNPIGLQFEFDFLIFFFFYGILVIFALVSETIIALYYYYSESDFPTKSGLGIWDFFFQKQNDKSAIYKVLVLIILLIVSAVVEEIAFRFFLINIFTMARMPLIYAIIISSLIFGAMHYQNGGWIYTVNSSFAGFIFAYAFLSLGFFTVSILHFLWNFLIIYQMFLPTLYEKKAKGG